MQKPHEQKQSGSPPNATVSPFKPRILILDDDTIVALLRKIRQVSPNALVVALSNTLDLETMEQLMNGGCNAVYNKRFPERSADARAVIRNYLEIVSGLKAGRAPGKITDVARSLRQLVSEMNKRLEDSRATA
jgi:DNA-binding NarL/FixJ family response regulator